MRINFASVFAGSMRPPAHAAWARVSATRLELPRKATEAYDLAEVYEGSPRSVWATCRG